MKSYEFYLFCCTIVIVIVITTHGFLDLTACGKWLVVG